MRRVSRILLLLSIGLGAAVPAEAGERLAMPYDCGLERGQVRLVPAAETSYRIIGKREEQAITACQPHNSIGCRTIMVHRFVISCGGTAVAWMRVAAAVKGGGTERAWIEDGRLNVVLPARQPPAAKPTCFDRPAGANNGLERRVVLKHDCLPWRRRSELDHVVLPPGYAPIGEFGARLLLEGPGAGEVQLAAVDPDAVWEPGVVYETNQDEVESATADDEWVTVVREASNYRPRPHAGNGILPWSWTWLLAGMALATVAAVARVRYPQAIPARLSTLGFRRGGVSDPTNAGEVVEALLKRTEAVVTGLKGAGPLREVLQSELDRVHRHLMSMERAAKDADPEDEQQEAKSATLYRALVRDLERIRRIAESAAASLSGGRPSAAALPRTKSEAYDVLGVNADVSEAVLKKIADALRMSWHPDHARDEDDRRQREERIRQINAAWELIAEKREAD